MAERGGILRRKASAGQVPGAAFMSPEKAAKLAFGKAGRDISGLGLRLSRFGMERTEVAQVAGAIAAGALVLFLSRAAGEGQAGAEGEAPGGVAALSGGLVASLVEARTTGRLATSAPEPRPPTRIDALIAADFLDVALPAFGDLAAGLSIAESVAGWRCGRMPASPAALPLVLDDRPMRLLRLGFDLGEAGREGVLLLAVPQDPPRAAGARPAAGAGAGLAAAVMGARAEVRAVLARLAMPLDTVGGWRPGTTLTLPQQAVAQVLVEDIDGAPVASGRLGQMNGARAIRIGTAGGGGGPDRAGTGQRHSPGDRA